MSFSELGLSEKVLEAVSAAGYTSPTPIQAQAIPPALAGRDILGIAQTGTGKTAAFTLPMLNRLETGRARARMPRTLILEPTRELAAQVEENFTRLGVNQKLSVALLIGGVSFADQDAKITRGADVLIATPGRLLDHFERGKLLLTGIEILVIDEADRMLDMGFIPDIERICKMVPFTRQTLFFSATMPPEIQQLTEAFLSNPVKVEVARPSSTASTITQRLVASGAEAYAKREVLRRLIRGAEDLQNAIIFCNRKRDVALLHRSLEKHGFNAVALHGDMDQRSRMQALDNFRNGGASLLVASDVAARGLDIPEVSHVFNFDVPFHAEDYVHRIGRTGRAGRSGYAASIVTTDDTKALAAIEALTGKSIQWEGKTLEELLAEQPEAGTSESRRERGRGGARGESRDRRDRSRREAPRPEKREPRAEEARSNTSKTPRAQPVRQEPVRQEPARYQPVRAGDNPVHSRPRYDDDSAVIGFGDHIPAFLLKKVVIKPFSDNIEEDEDHDIEVVNEAVPTKDAASKRAADDQPEADQSSKRDQNRRRKRKKRTVEIATPADAAAPADEAAAVTTSHAPEAVAAAVDDVAATSEPAPHVEAEVSAPAEVQGASVIAEEAPKKPARRSRKKAAPKEVVSEEATSEQPASNEAAQPAVEPEAAPAKPVRRRSKKTEVAAEADTASATTDAPAAAETPKPARKRSTRATTKTAKATADAVDTSAAEVVPAETTVSSEEPAKPVRKRAPRKKAETAETETAEKPAPRRTTRKKATPAETEPATDENLSLADVQSSDT
ncbi:superfamily II DNA/RNA helicase [Pseudochelatococcus contaminans]|uniref:DEAD-box ATP-dependent RNA helicase RhpA n=1 Tax=Pseudochelatococcus contaminans TaxID=1538103 RepID=A0A7W5Z1V5_9HYPH|nr:superfamily II DNA/RNA helicase [Pseudochelatococcus contaminans]